MDYFTDGKIGLTKRQLDTLLDAIDSLEQQVKANRKLIEALHHNMEFIVRRNSIKAP